MNQVLYRDGERLVQAFLSLVDEIITPYADELVRMAVTGKRQELANARHVDNFLSEIDVRLHNEFRRRVAEILPVYLYISEEGEPEVYPDGDTWPDLAVIVDPLDGSETAVRGLRAHTHLTVYSLTEQTPLLSIVGNLFHHVRLYYAFYDANRQHRAYLKTRSGET